MTSRQIEILRCLRDRGQSYPYEIAQQTGQPISGIYNRINTLFREGLIESVPIPREYFESRGPERKWIRLTAAGEAALQMDEAKVQDLSHTYSSTGPE